MTEAHGRRGVLVGFLGAGAVLVGCGGPGSSTSAQSSGSGSASASGGVSVGRVPVGGGIVVKDQDAVVTQPEPGQFKAFSASCTHQGCIVDTIRDGTIECPCHGSRFSIADGSVVHGPATQPLPPKTVMVTGDTLTIT